MINKVFSMLGLSMKAGKLVCGTDVCIENIKNKKVYLIVIANDASENTKEKFERLCKQYEINLIYFGDKFSLSRAVGKVDKAVYAVLDKGFSEKILQIEKENQKGATN